MRAVVGITDTIHIAITVECRVVDCDVVEAIDAAVVVIGLDVIVVCNAIEVIVEAVVEAVVCRRWMHAIAKVTV